MFLPSYLSLGKYEYSELPERQIIDSNVVVFRLKAKYSSDNQMLQRMQKEGKVIITPGKDLNGQVVTCNPNPFVLDIAKLTGGLIVSNYDFQAEQSLDAGIQFIEKRTCIYKLLKLWIN